MKRSESDFLAQLAKEASFQAELHRSRVLPSSVDWFTSLVGRYPWQIIAFLAAVTTIVIEAIKFGLFL